MAPKSKTNGINGVEDPVKQNGHVFDARKSNELVRKRQAHDTITTVIVCILLPTAVVVAIVYLILLCRQNSCVKNGIKLIGHLAGRAVYSARIHPSHFLSAPFVFGILVSFYYLLIFYFNSTIPGVKPPLPQVGFFRVKADANYSFALLVGTLCLIVYALPDVFFCHTNRIYQ